MDKRSTPQHYEITKYIAVMLEGAAITQLSGWARSGNYLRFQMIHGLLFESLIDTNTAALKYWQIRVLWFEPLANLDDIF